MKGRVHTALKLAHHRHTARPLAHHHTSYRALFVVIATMGLTMVTIQYVSASTYSVTATVPTDDYTYSAVLTSPVSGSTVTAPNVQITGTCEVVRSGTYVTLLRGSQALGSTTCSSAGTFTLNITLEEGQNVLLVAQTSGSGNDGPQSAPVSVAYTIAVPSEELENSGGISVPPRTIATSRQRLLTIQPQGSTLVQDYTSTETIIEFMILFGAAPYSVEANWGDGAIETVQLARAGQSLQLRHTYKQIGSFTVAIRAIDALGAQTTIQYIAMVSKPLALATPAIIRPSTGLFQSLNSAPLLSQIVWVSYALVSMGVIGLWLISPSHTLLESIAVRNSLKVGKIRR